MEVVVTRKGQVTIPVEIRRRLGIEEGARLLVWEEDGKVVMKVAPSIFDLGGSGAEKLSVEEAKRLLDKMREEDA